MNELDYAHCMDVLVKDEKARHAARPDHVSKLRVIRSAISRLSWDFRKQV